MSEYYDQFHRWEPLAEFHFNLDDYEDMYDDNYVYCLCSRAFIRDGVKTYYVEKDASESDMEFHKDIQMQDWEDQSHVHFSLDTSYKVKCEKDENASCYCSASHTDNYYSTDEHDPAQNHCSSHALQPSDSGADLTYPDYQSDNTNHDKLEKMDQDFTNQSLVESNEDYLSINTWEKFWAVHGERLIWASWIKKYSDYINPDFLDENNHLLMDEKNIPKKQHSADLIFNTIEQTKQQQPAENDMRERKFSYDSKVNPYKKRLSNQNSTERGDKYIEKCNKDDVFVPIGRRRSCSEHDRMLSPRTLAGTDSMTNVTKITLSSYDISSGHVTSESSPTDDYSVTSSSSDDPSNDQTRIVNVNAPSEEQDTDEYWQFLWKKHFGEQYALHYANFVESQNQLCYKNVPTVQVVVVPESKVEEKVGEIEGENSEGNSQEMPSVIEIQGQVNDMKIEDRNTKKRNKKINLDNPRYVGSVGYILQNLLKEEQEKVGTQSEVLEAGDADSGKSEPTAQDMVDGATNTRKVLQSESKSDFSHYSYNEGDNDPPEEKMLKLKRSHELDEDEESAEKVKTTFEIMGFCLQEDNMPIGQVVYRKGNRALRPPRSKKIASFKKTYFDDDGNPYQIDQADSQEEREMQTDDDCVEVKFDYDKVYTPIAGTEFKKLNQNQETVNEKRNSTALEASKVPFPDAETSFSDFQDESEPKPFEGVVGSIVKRRRRVKRNRLVDNDGVIISDMPPELAGDPKMRKYWRRRHSLFHRFDEGIKLDKESWFSVTPENVAWHIANKCGFDVVLDAFCGAGGNTIQFAKTCKKVIAVDIDPVKIEMAQHNAQVYGVADRIEFIVGDFFELAPRLYADMVFLSPPWGGPNYSENKEYDIEVMLEPRPASELMRVARQINTNVTLYLPRNTRSDQILALAKEARGSVEVEQSYLDKRFVAITAYFY
ncbi:trimethylguanosine synthase [Hyposmocoma kahamanoa]|uniref:trimethylguanosine synthase n=1 Tax=Hyposmocoma kahamanoa TaxID=1477025 RepID=UPI000E6DA0C8|nr:trimethylguanosine synthase [Hyposmocoma kahamanoa]